MWLSLNNAFLSIVSKDCKPDELMVRARVAGHIEAVFPDAKVSKTPGNDYLFRAIVPRSHVALALSEMAMNIDYDNFKDSVFSHELHGAYSRVWGVMSSLQEIPPYSMRRRPRHPDLFE